MTPSIMVSIVPLLLLQQPSHRSADSSTMISIVPFLLLVLLMLGLGRWVLSPLRKAALDPRPPVQFLLTDIFILITQFGVAGAVVLGSQPHSETAVRAILAIALWCIVALSWWLCVRWLSHAGIRIAKRRSAVLGLAMPLSFIVIPLTVLVPLPVGGVTRSSTSSSAAGMQTTIDEDYMWVYGFRLDVPPYLAENFGLIITACVVVSAVSCFWIARRIARWAVQGQAESTIPAESMSAPG